MSRSDLAETIFGGFDGMVSALGVVAGFLVTHAPRSVMFASVGGLAVASMVSMAGGQYLADSEVAGRLRRALAMGGATMVGAFLPAVPYLILGGPLGASASLGVGVGMTVIIAEERVRAGAKSRLGAYSLTFGVAIVAGLAAIVVALAFGAVGA